MIIENFFLNKFNQKDGVYIFDKDDKYAENFSNQWIDFNRVQVDSYNKYFLDPHHLQML